MAGQAVAPRFAGEGRVSKLDIFFTICEAHDRLPGGVRLGTARRIEQPWGFELWWAATDLYTGKLLHVEAGHRLAVRDSIADDDSCYLLAGRIVLFTGTPERDAASLTVDQGSCWRNPPGNTHIIEAVEPSDVLAVSTQLEQAAPLADLCVEESMDRGWTPTAHGAARLVDHDQIALKLGLSRTQTRELIATPGFPPPVAYFRGRCLWDEAKIDGLTVEDAQAVQRLTVLA